MRVPAPLKGIALLVITFAAGALSGVLYERREPAFHGVPPNDTHDALHHLTRELNLDPVQQRTISEIIARHQSEIDATWHAMQPHMHSTLESTSREILAALRPDQAVKYQRMIESSHLSAPH